MASKMEFQVVLEDDPEVGGFTATVPALPEIVVDASSEKEALRLVRQAIQFTLEERATDAPTQPATTTRPARARLVTVDV
jgi:predicted RNase H-like HicB family nuclease